MTPVDLQPIKESISRVSPQQQVELANWLLSVLGLDGVDESEDELEQEMLKRLDDFDSGRVKALTEEEFWAGLKRNQKY